MAVVAEIAPFERPSRVRLVAFDDITLSTNIRYLVKGLLPRTGLIVVWGPPKSGKSFWTFDVAMHVALGWDYRGRRVQPGPVVYCAFEGQTGLETRVEAFRQRFLPAAPAKGEADERPPVPFYLEPATLDLVGDHVELISVIRRQLTDAKPVAVVLDTLNRSLRGSESSDEDMTAYIRASDTIREAFGCAVIIVHHCGIEGTRPRGHTSLTGAVDAQISIKREPDETIIATLELCKDGPQGEIIASRLEQLIVGCDDECDEITSCVIVPAEGEHTPSSKPVKVTGAAKTALDLLGQALDAEGQKSPGGPHFAGAKTVVKVSVWRTYCQAGTISEADTAASAQKAFKRSSEKLQALGFIGVWADFVWLRTKRT